MGTIELHAVTVLRTFDRQTTQTGAVIALEARGASLESERAPLSCVLLLDVSGSMEGPPIEQVIASVERLTGLVQADDELGIVAFSDRATTIAPLTRMNEAGKRLLRARARRLEASGRTNIEHGITTAVALLGDAQQGGRATILLLSDGEPNVGASTAQALAALAKQQRPTISISSLGYGDAHNEDILEAIATGGGGSYQLIPDPASCQRELAVALGTQGDVVAGAVELLLMPAGGVEIQRFIGDPQVRFGAAPTLDIPDLVDGGRHLVALQLSLDPAALRSVLLAGRLRYRDVAADELRSIEVSLPLSSWGDAKIDPQAIAWFLLARSEEERRRARALTDRGNFAGAAAALRAFLKEIDAAPGLQPEDGSELWEAHELIHDEAVAYERMPSREDYARFRKNSTHVRLDRDGATSFTQAAGPYSQRAVASAAGDIPVAFLVCDGQRTRLGAECCIGRTKAADLRVKAANVSRRHALVYALDGGFWIRDLGSTNTTTVNGDRLASEARKLQHGDRIRVGTQELLFQIDA